MEPNGTSRFSLHYFEHRVEHVFEHWDDTSWLNQALYWFHRSLGEIVSNSSRLLGLGLEYTLLLRIDQSAKSQTVRSGDLGAQQWPRILSHSAFFAKTSPSNSWSLSQKFGFIWMDAVAKSLPPVSLPPVSIPPVSLPPVSLPTVSLHVDSLHLQFTFTCLI